jgi:RNA-directed DNA polymerase
MKFVGHRIADNRVARHIQKWLNAGAMEEGRRTTQEQGTPQGGSISPLLANLYLHHVFDLHAEKTRVIEFGRFAAERRAWRGLGKPDTFNFLGFTHACGQTLKGKFVVLRHTMAARVRAKLQDLKQELRRRMHQAVAQTGAWLASVLRGHDRYYGVPRNSRKLAGFHDAVRRLWHRALNRRSQKGYVTESQMSRLVKCWFPRPLICHPYPEQSRGLPS